MSTESNPSQSATPPTGWHPAQPYRTEDPRKVSVPLAMVLSLMPGLGQVYLGRYQNGFLNIIVVASLIALLNGNVGLLEPLLGLFLAFFWMFNIMDAGRQAHLWNQALLRLEAPAPEALVQDRFGSLLTGVGLIGLGLIALAHKLFGFSLAWVAHWWPVALIILGILVVWKALTQDRTEVAPQA